MTPMRALALLLPLLLVGQACADGATDLAEALNQVRAQAATCKGVPVAAAPALTYSPALARAAAVVAARGGEGDLNATLTQAGYRARKTMLLRLSGLSNAQALADYASSSFCEALRSPDYSEIGVHQSGSGAQARSFILLARPHGLPAAADARNEADFGARVLAQVNQARATARNCGNRRFGPAAPVVWNDKLAAAAQAHASEMAQTQAFSHTGRDGKGVDARATRAGYAWKNVGENIAAGQANPEEVTAGWIASPGHCANLMNPAFTAMGVAYALSPGSRMGIYWTQVFAAPR